MALIPAIMYYLTVLFFVHFEAQKQNLSGQPKENLPKIRSVLKEGLHFIIPLAILMFFQLYFLTDVAGLRPDYAGWPRGTAAAACWRWGVGATIARTWRWRGRRCWKR